MRGLVADASATMRALAKNALRRAGATDVLTAATVEEALAACETPFEIAVVDRDFGTGPGWTWLSELREKACPEGRLIVTGTRVTRDEVEAMRTLGAGAFLLKPLDPERLAERVQVLLAGPASEAAEGEASGEPESGEEPLAEAA